MTLIDSTPPEDPLASLTVVSEKCLVCGSLIRTDFEKEVKEEMWLVCSDCGHVVPATNKIKWQ